MAGRRVAGKVTAVTVLARVLRWALALVAADLVDARATISAERRVLVTLVDVLFAGLSEKEGCACADEVVLQRRAVPAIGTWI